MANLNLAVGAYHNHQRHNPANFGSAGVAGYARQLHAAGFEKDCEPAGCHDGVFSVNMDNLRK